MALARRSLRDSSVSGDGVLSPACAMSKSYPNILEFLSRVRWEDGATRVSGTLMFLVDDGTLKMCLNDRDTVASVFLSGNSLTDLLKKAEAGLGDGSLDFRVKRDAHGSPKKKNG